MKKREILAFTLLVAVLSMNMIMGSMAYALDIHPAEDRTTVVNWQVTQAPQTAFNMYFTGAGYCLIDPDSTLSFTVGDINSDVEGLLVIGNVSILANDTDVSRDLVLGVGIYSAFEPGLFVEIGASNFDDLNASAYASAQRASGNWMNGTMSSSYGNVSIGDSEFEAITFDYEQDTPFAGDPQRTRLIYDITTGVLLYANTSYWFGEGSEPYWLEIEFLEITYTGPFPLTTIYYIIIASIIVVILIALVVRRRK